MSAVGMEKKDTFTGSISRNAWNAHCIVHVWVGRLRRVQKMNGYLTRDVEDLAVLNKRD